VSAQLPAGPRATISSGDWSGVGAGEDGESWDLETCQFLVEAIGTNNITDMFLPRAWSLEWLTAHCRVRFGLTPAPRALPDAWGFDAADLPRVTSRIVFTNGLNDGWSAGGLQENMSDTLLAFNMPLGAHHSDLNHK
jgi:lysosomal Pro-X carboxypeptidase